MPREGEKRVIVAVMQPYFFPYLGYWQLARAVDTFVILGDVNYIVRGWVNRNRILINGEPHYVTVPLLDASQNRTIDDTVVDPSTVWRDKMVRTLDMAYRKAPYFTGVFPLLENLIREPAERLGDYLSHQLRTISAWLGMATTFVRAQDIAPKASLHGQDRILAICEKLGATTYRNLPGGRSLYDAESFARLGLKLEFISMRQETYRQIRATSFVPGLSLIDVLMSVGPDGARELLLNHDISPG